MILRHRGIVLFAAALATLLAVVGALRLRLDFSSTAFYGDDAKAANDLAAHRSRWGPDDRTLVLVAQAQGGGAVLEGPSRDALRRLAAALEALPEVDRVTILLDVPAPPDALGYPLVPVLRSEDGSRATLLVDLAESTDDLARTVEMVDAVDDVIAQHGDDALMLQSAGVPAIRASFFALTLRDQALFTPLTFAIMALLLWLLFRRLHAVLVPLVASLLPLLWTMGTLGWVGEPLGLLNQAYFTLIPVITVADSVHLVSRAQEEAQGDALGSSPRPPREVLVRAVGRVGYACLLTSLTTAAGFASLAAGGLSITGRFGLFAAVGVLYGWIAVVVVAPALLSFARHLAVHPSRRTDGAWIVLLRPALERPRLWCGVCLGLAVMAVLATPRVRIDSRLSALLSEDHPVRQASEHLDRELGGTLSIEVELRGGRWTEPTDIAHLRAFERWAAAQPEVRAVFGPTTLSNLLPPGTDATLQARLASIPGLPPVFAPDGTARIILRVPDLGAEPFLELEARIRGALASLPFETTVTGTASVAYHGLFEITEDLRTSAALAFATIGLLMVAALRSVRLALLGVPPNLLPLLVAYGAMGVIGVPLDPLAAVILVVGLGIAVDDTIHLLVRHEEEARPGVEPTTAIERTLSRSGRAVAFTSLVLTLGLSINTFSSFPPLRMLGTLGAGLVMLALVADLLLLPALLVLAKRSRPTAGLGSRPGS